MSGKKGDIRITGVTTGKIIDMGIKDSMNMGAAMAPAAADVIAQNLEDFGRKPTDYDKIITGDLGYIGQEILINLLKQKKIDISGVHEDPEYQCGRKRVRLFCRYVVCTLSAHAKRRQLKAHTVCPHRGAFVHRELQ